MNKKKKLLITGAAGALALIVATALIFILPGECEHEWGEWSTSTASTCAIQGTKQRKCLNCDEAQTESLDIGEHEYDTQNISWAWDSSNSATAILTCVNDITHTRQIAAAVTDEITTPATCTAAGSKTHTATVTIDGNTYTNSKTEAIAAAGHTPITVPGTSATCMQTGLTDSTKCSVCNEVITEGQEIPKTSHTEVNIPAVAATCLSTGLTAGKKCSVCGEITAAQQTTNKTAHTPKTMPAVSATCLSTGLTEGKKCAVCNEVMIAQQTTAKTSHTVVTAAGSLPTCSAEGVTAGKKCSVCQIVIEGGEPIEKLPHTEETIAAVQATCSATGLTEGKKCVVCQEVLIAQMITQKTSHNYVAVVTAPDCESGGFTTHTCSMCSDNYLTNLTDPLGHTWGEWEIYLDSTIRFCTRSPLCRTQAVTSIEAKYTGPIRLTGETVREIDVSIVATLSDGSTYRALDFTIEDNNITTEGRNYVTIKCYSFTASIAVPAIYGNLPGTTADSEFTYTTKNNAVTITGFIGDSTNIVVPAHIDRVPVRSIADNVFKNNESITSVTIPNSITSIGSEAFYGCKRMASVSFGSGLTTIGYNAFTNCISLTEVTIPKNVITIHGAWGEAGVFENCTSLKKVTIGDDSSDLATTTVGERAFKGCTSLETLYIGNQVKEIADNAFRDCTALKTVTIGTQVQSIGDSAFYNCESIESITIPDSIITIESSAFYGCKRMASVSFGSGLTTIGYNAFTNCISLTEVTIPKNVITIHGAWGEAGVFENCTSLKKVTIGDDSSDLATTTVGERAFKGCTALTEVYLGSNVLTVADNAFEGCIQLQNFNFGTGAQSVGSRAFAGCTALSSIKIPANIMSLGDEVFYGCTSLQEVLIEKRNEIFRSFGGDVFDGCYHIDRIYYTGTADDWSKIAISEDNGYPLNITPYYYSSVSPAKIGNYWYYNASNAKRVWNVSEDAYRAEEYSENFAEIFGDEDSSYATIFYNDLKNDTTLMLGIQAWELVHIAAEPTYIFDPNNSLISKKDLYKLTLYDIMTGENAETKTAFFDFFDQSSMKFMLYIGNMFLGDPADDPIDADMLYDVLHNKKPSAIQAVLEKAMSPTDIEVAMAIIGFAENAYEALKSVSQYTALRQIKSGYVDVLMAIYNDTSNPDDLRNAALELVKWYQDACDLTLAEFQMKTFDKATNEDIYSWTLDKLVDVAIDSDTTGLLKAVNFAGKAIQAIAEPLELDAFCQAYYQLKTSVGVESALRKLIQVITPDYMRYENQGTSETYMCTVELYENSVLCGFDYSIDLLAAYVNSSTPDDEGMADYNNLVAALNSYKTQKQNSYITFDNAVLQKYGAYYS